MTLQHLYPVLSTSETDVTVNFLAQNETPRHKCMLKLGEHLYMVGRPQCTVLDSDEAATLGLRAQATAEVFTQLFKDGVLYQAKSFRSEGNVTIPCVRTATEFNYALDRLFSFLFLHSPVQ